MNFDLQGKRDARSPRHSQAEQTSGLRQTRTPWPMRSFTVISRIVGIFLVFAAITPGLAQNLCMGPASAADVEAEAHVKALLRGYMTQHCDAAAILTFDHERLCWRAYRWSDGAFTTLELEAD